MADGECFISKFLNKRKLTFDNELQMAEFAIHSLIRHFPTLQPGSCHKTSQSLRRLAPAMDALT